MLRLCSHATLPLPSTLLRFLGLIAEFAEHPRRLPRLPPLLRRLVHLSSDDLPQSLIARHAEHKGHVVAFAPAHQRITAESGISAQDDSYRRPGGPNLPHDPFYFCQAPEGCVVIGLSQPRAQNLFSAKNVERQIAVAIVITVEEPALLFAVQSQIGGVHVQDDLGWCALVGLDEYLYQQLIHRIFPESDLLVTVLSAGPQLHPIQRALAGQRGLQFLSSCQNPEDRVLAQLLMIVEIFIAQFQTIDPLRKHLLNRVFHLVLIP